MGSDSTTPNFYAFAVALILASPEFEVLGFVMDHGNTLIEENKAPDCEIVPRSMQKNLLIA
jgi:predicted peroxiredoxin